MWSKEGATLNKRDELFGYCKHRWKHLLAKTQKIYLYMCCYVNLFTCTFISCFDFETQIQKYPHSYHVLAEDWLSAIMKQICTEYMIT